MADPLGRVVEIGKDVLAGNNEYEVIGPVAQIEEAPASDVADLKLSLSEIRRVRIQVYKWQVSE